MIIYRVENESGAGPFGLRSDISSNNNYAGDEYPSPSEEKLALIPTKHYCAVMNLELFNHWFSDVLHQLTDFFFCEIEIDDEYVQVGVKQCVFLKSKAKYISKTLIKEMIQNDNH